MRSRTWNETLDTGPIVYVWAQYVPVDGGNPIAIGISPVPDGTIRSCAIPFVERIRVAGTVHGYDRRRDPS